jgi:SAM-dependent methyltransferase
MCSRNLLDIVRRQPVPEPWSEGEKIPWNEPGFSQRMLLEHLSQEHDAASRRFPTIDRHVEWIHQTILAGQPARILDLGCGPGLYASRLARLGHECVGIDFSPASIAYAREFSLVDNLRCTYLEQDIRAADYGEGYGLVMLIYGEFNVFRRSDARATLERAQQALAQGGHLLLEVHTLGCVRAIGQQPATWYSADKGLFSDYPHLYLTESFWDAQQNVATQRYLIVDAATGRATRYAASTQGYTEQEYQSLLEECGFRDVVFRPSLHGDPDESQQGLVAIVCQKGEDEAQ